MLDVAKGKKTVFVVMCLERLAVLKPIYCSI